MSSLHIPILVEPILKALTEPFLKLPKDAEPHWFLDCTLGGGGHCRAFLEAFKAHPFLQKHRILALDRDLSVIHHAQSQFKDEIESGKLEIRHLKFGSAKDLLLTRPILALLADLGFSSDQLEDSNRGLSFQREGPLDMRLDPTEGVSCQELLAQISEADLEELLRMVGEERFSRRIARSIIQNRQRGNLPKTTRELSEMVIKALPSFARHGRIHAATRSFQALRIAVNHELDELNSLLNDCISAIRPGGRVAILSFHSLEDRQVKYKFKKDESWIALTKKPIEADENEIQKNPRARSAKLRMAELRGS